MDMLRGKVAIVTGGSSGIGRSTATTFAHEGATVVIAARGVERAERVVREIEMGGGEARFFRADVSIEADVEALVRQTIEWHGRLDCAFNNAATLGERLLPTADLEESELDRMLATNLKSVWFCMKHEIRQMLRQDPVGGVIVNTSSVNGLGGAPAGSFYAATKAGVLALTKSAAYEYGPQRIRVNALVAGAFRTPMLMDSLDRISGGDLKTLETIKTQFAQLTALGRIGEPEEAAAAVAWLCSDAASYVTGHSLIVDGGLTASSR